MTWGKIQTQVSQ